MAQDNTQTSPSTEEQAAPPQAQPAPPTSEWAQIALAFRWPAALVLIVLIGFLVYRETLQQAGRAAEAIAETAGNIASGVWSGNVTESFLASIPEFDPEGSGNLEVATITATETFTRSDERKVLWDTISIGVTTTEIRVPVTYRYHLRLADTWRLEVEDGVCYVLAPQIRPSLPPAIHTDRMEKRTEADWLRFNEEDQMAALERSITPTLETYAADERHLEVVRENARRAVEEFVKTWLLREEQWEIERVQSIEVVFPDEEGTVRPSPLEIEEPRG